MTCKRCGGRAYVAPEHKKGIRTRWYECENCGPIGPEDVEE